MAGPSDSNDASDIFWPGYVDAISNLAINLLFVIAVMCIVILSFVLEGTAKSQPQPQASQATPQQATQYVDETTRALAGELTRQIEAVTTANSEGNPGLDVSKENQATVQSVGAQQVVTEPAHASDGKEVHNATKQGEPGQPGSPLVQPTDAQAQLQALDNSNRELRQSLQQLEEALQSERARVAQAQQASKEQATRASQAEQSLQSEQVRAAKVQQELTELAKQATAQAEQLRQELSAARSKLNAQARAAKTSTTSAAAAQSVEAPQQSIPTPQQTPQVDVMRVTKEPIQTPKGPTTLSTVSAGLIVQFDPKVVTLAASEQKDLVQRLGAFASLVGTRWQITAITPKGFSESARLAYYRTVAVRNALIQAGVAPSQIQVRVLESVQEGADAARVTINPVN